MRTPRAARLVLAMTAFAAAVLVPGAAAFESVPPGSSVHDDLTAVAKEAGWGDRAVQALQQAVREPDFNETELDPKADKVARIDATDDYRPEHHCDRVPPATDAAAFEATVAYIQQQRDEATRLVAAGDANGSMAALGRALHALQDCYSHSNIVDLPDQHMAFEQALLKGGAAVPGLRLVAFQPEAEDPEDPPGDAYTHKDFAKDGAHKNDEADAELDDGQTKFESAVALARMATVAFLQEFTHSLPSDQQALLMQVDEEDRGAPDDFNIPGPSGAFAILALAALVAIGRRR